jgi:hypothetical protein
MSSESTTNTFLDQHNKAYVEFHRVSNKFAKELRPKLIDFLHDLSGIAYDDNIHIEITFDQHIMYPEIKIALDTAQVFDDLKESHIRYSNVTKFTSKKR